MARGRMLSKSLSTSKKYAQLYSADLQPTGLVCQALYPLIVAHSDDFGRLEGDVFTIKNSVVPASNWAETVIEAALALLHRVQLVVWYEIDHALYLQVADFDRHQVGLHKRTKSRYPRVPGNSRKVRQLPLQLKRTELNGTEGNRTTSSAADAALPPPPAERPEDNYGVIEKLAHTSIDILGVSDLGDLVEDTKRRCADARIAYSGAVVTRAVDSAVHQRGLR
jgi:hypothetical protein